MVGFAIEYDELAEEFIKKPQFEKVLEMSLSLKDGEYAFCTINPKIDEDEAYMIYMKIKGELDRRVVVDKISTDEATNLILDGGKFIGQ